MITKGLKIGYHNLCFLMNNWNVQIIDVAHKKNEATPLSKNKSLLVRITQANFLLNCFVEQIINNSTFGSYTLITLASSI